MSFVQISPGRPTARLELVYVQSARKDLEHVMNRIRHLQFAIPDGERRDHYTDLLQNLRLNDLFLEGLEGLLNLEVKNLKEKRAPS